MGRHDNKANPANPGRSAHQSSLAERQAAVSDEEINEDVGIDANADDGEPIDGTREVTAGNTADTPSWGVEEKKRRFTKEVLIAFVAIGLLVAVFAVIVYKNFRKSSDAEGQLAAAPEANLGSAATTSDPFAESTSVSESTSQQSQSQDLQSNSEPSTQVLEVVQNQSEPTESNLDDDPFGTTQRPMGLFDRQVEVAQNEPNESTNSFGSEQASNPFEMQSEPAEEPESTQDLFANSPSDTQSNSPFGSDAETEMTSTVSSLPNETLVGSPFESPVRPEPTTAFEPQNTFTPEPVPIPREPQPFEAASNSGEYVVKEGDTFWSISKKLYGTYGLFLALSEYNRNVIPVADRLRPGTTIRTPDINVLKTLAAKVSTTQARPIVRRDSVAAVGTTTARRSTDDSDAGFFLSTDGFPMYRIGKNDTLAQIAADHLGRAERWKQIFNMNRDRLKSEEDLQLGSELLLPADASRVPLTADATSRR